MKKKSFAIFCVLMVMAFLLVGCSSSSIQSTATPAIYAIVNDGGVLCSSNTMITYRTNQRLDMFDCDQEGLIVSGSQNLKALVTVSNFSPVKGETVTGAYSFIKDQSVSLDNCEISAGNTLHERVNDGKFTILATGETTTYTLRCIDEETSVEAEFTLRTPAFGG